ncbi:MAG: carboxylating nicotinate-nucleotide diphosphorylase [Myxococcota bacterium]|nr:carboxylating nicotinate-nucleotide diphosphorylase [Myxococcota bacterium]
MTRFTPTPHLDTLIDLALSEDIGCGDATVDALIPMGTTAQMTLVAREQLILCGRPIVDRVIERYRPLSLRFDWDRHDGELIAAGDTLCRVSGLLSEMLTLERTVLNFLQRMSGVATLTRRYVDAISGTEARLVDTRKTLPGYRALDKYATRVGGAKNHRASLDGGILIKDNHLTAAGGVEEAIRKARAAASHALTIEVEVETMDDFRRAVRAGADVIMLDNFTPEEIRQAAAIDRGGARLEASGGISLDSIRTFAESGVDLIAVGALTHSAPAVDIAAEIVDA